MIRLKLSLFLLLSLSACEQNIEHQDLIGIWKSNKELTLESIRQSKSENITEKHEEIWSKLGFGEEIYEYRKDKVRLSVDSMEEKFNFTDKYRRYSVLEVTDEYFEIKSYDIVFEKLMVKKLFRKGDCFYEYMSHYEFKNYYCRVNGKEL